MEDELPDIGKKTLRKVARIDRCIEKLRRDDQGAFMALTNALEHHLAIYPSDPDTIRHLARALDAFVRAREIDAESAGFAEQLHDLLECS